MAGGLTEKQKRFVDFYIQTGNATDAARKAGYKHPNQVGPENLVKLGIRAAIDARLKEIENIRIADAAEVMQFLTSALRGELKEEVVVVEDMGGKNGSAARIVEKQIGAHDRIDAAKQLAKRYGLDGDGELLKLQKEKLKAEVDEMKAAPGDALHINFTFDRRPKDGH